MSQPGDHTATDRALFALALFVLTLPFILALALYRAARGD